MSRRIKFNKFKRELRHKYKRILFRMKKIVREPVPEIQSLGEFANLLGIDSLGLSLRVSRAMSLKTSHLPDSLPPELDHCQCGGLDPHPRGTCLAYKAIIKDKERIKRKRR